MPIGRGVIKASLALLLFAIVGAAGAGHATQEPVTIRLAHGSAAEARTADTLRALIDRHDLGHWLLTRDVVIDERAIPHSHPVLTLHTRHTDETPRLVATFLHEQFHWLETGPMRSAFRAAMRELRALYPAVPSARDGGARDPESTWRHLLVCDLELQALSTVVGAEAAREILATTTHYAWVYEAVLSDPRIRAIALRWGFDVSGGIRGRGVDAVAALDPTLLRQDSELRSLLGDARIVLLGENGHGVAEFTQLKAALVQWLHREHGFDRVVFESGAQECAEAQRSLRSTSAAAALRACLRFPFEHAEALPVFEYARTGASAAGPLQVAGMDPQAQGFDSEQRPLFSHRVLVGIDPTLARRVARADTALFLHPEQGGLGPAAPRFAAEHRDSLQQLYRAAAARTQGTDRLMFRLAFGWIDRLALQGTAAAEGAAGPPARYYELRDEWMARAVSYFADSLEAPERVIVWLHNDHARYGRFPAGGDSIRSTGDFLRERYGDAVVSVGLFMGRGTIADNARRPRAVAPIPAQGVEDFLSGDGAFRYLVLRGNVDPWVQAWGAAERPYLRMGVDTLTMSPAREFDVLLYVDSVRVPSYRVP